LSISYERIKTIRSSLAFELNEKYHKLGLVYPSQLQNKTFTTSAIDNFDYNLQSSTVKESIHWTGISIFQYPNSSSNTSAVSSYRIKDSTRKVSSLDLPASYTNTAWCKAQVHINIKKITFLMNRKAG